MRKPLFLFVILGAIASAGPAAGQGQEQIIQLILNITNGSPSTPGQIGYQVLAERNLRAAIEATDAAIEAGPGNLEAIQRNIRATALSIDPPADFDGGTQGFVRSVAGIAANAAIAAQLPDASQNVKSQAPRIEASADNLIEWSREVIDLASQVLNATRAGDAQALALQIRARLAVIENGTDANGDGTIAPIHGEGGFAQIKSDVRQLAGGEGL